MILFWLAADFVIELLFGYGKFLKVDTQLASFCLQCFAFSLPFIMSLPILYRGLQARQLYWGVTLTSGAGVAAAVLANIIFVVYWELGIPGLALAAFLSNGTSFGLGLFILFKVFPWQKLVTTTCKALGRLGI